MNIRFIKNRSTQVVAALFFILFSNSLLAKEAYSSNVKILDWNGLEVVWLEENKFPTYNLSVYFADGALSDHPSRTGETALMFKYLDLGTTLRTHREITDGLEFYGVDYESAVTHEYSSFNVSGLMKDIIPTVKLICHMMKDATFPKKQLNREKRRNRSMLLGLVDNKRALASKVFRELSLKGSAYSSPKDGRLRDRKRITPKVLKNKKDYFFQKVKKRIYLSGPKEILNLKDIFLNGCGWNVKEANYARTIKKEKFKKAKGPDIFLVTVPNANQAQIQIGRYLGYDEIQESELMTLTSSLLGGGFTSILMREIRVKRGLTYGVSAYASEQKEYGRVGIVSFTKNKTVNELITVVKQSLENVSKSKFDNESLERVKGYLTGSYPFRFESSEDYLHQLIHLDHIGKSYEALYNFPEKIKTFTKKDIERMNRNLFSWKKQTIVVLGNKKLKKQLKKLGTVKVLNYKKFL